jgi:hypothetical protein
LLAFMALYGVSALVIRDFAIRIGGGPATILLLGLAFGIVNEGMVAHSLFNPGWPDVGVLGSYGRWGGVNWLWTEWIVPFHAVWSISFPIFLSRQLWPEVRDRRFLTDRTMVALVPIPFLLAIVWSFAFHPYPLGAADWVGMFAAIAALTGIAWRWGPRISRARPLGAWRPSPTLAATSGVLFFVVGQIGTWQTPDLGPYPEVGFVLLGLAWLAFGLFAMALDTGSLAEERARFAFVLGGIGFYTALSPFSEFGLGRIGLVPIDLVVLGLLIWLYRRRTAEVPPVPPGAAGVPVGVEFSP